MPYLMVESWSEFFKILALVHKLFSLQRQTTLLAQQILMHVQGMFLWSTL